MPDEGTTEDQRGGIINPFAAPSRGAEKTRIDLDSSVFAEPWMQNVVHIGAPDFLPGLTQEATTDIEPDESVWDEPALSRPLIGDVSGLAADWFGYFEEKSRRISASRSWCITLAMVIFAGPLAIAGTLIQGLSSSGLTMIFIMGPTVEEIMKVAFPLWIVERRPWLIRSVGQILLCGLCSGLAFAAVENLIYLNVYITDASPGIAQWRWSVCMLLHAGCSVVASLGVARVWRSISINRSRPDLSRGAAWLLTAIILHGSYNAIAVLLENANVAF